MSQKQYLLLVAAISFVVGGVYGFFDRRLPAEEIAQREQFCRANKATGLELVRDDAKFVTGVLCLYNGTDSNNQPYTYKTKSSLFKTGSSNENNCAMVGSR